MPYQNNAMLIPIRNISVELSQGKKTLPVYNYQQLLPGLTFLGPALIVSEDTTILISLNDHVTVDTYQNLRIDINLDNYL
jgi:N-methylhydantoinase A/oxoprolinase/acetone carboxylase beta subunit